MSTATATTRHSRFAACGVVLLLTLCAACPALAQTAGKFLVSVGDVKLVGKDGKARTAERGGELLEGDTIVTGANSLAQIRLQDNGLISVRPNTEMKLDKFAFAGADDRKATLLISLVKGGLRSITGLIGKAHREGYRISTASATIGIRGTDHEPFYIPPGQTALGTPGTYDKVNSGMTFVQGRQGNPVDVTISQVAFVPVTGAQPVILPSIPSFYKQDLPVPDPQSRKSPAGDSETASGKGTDTRAAGVDSKTVDGKVLDSKVLDSNVKSLSTTALTPLDTKTTTTVLTTPLTTTVAPTTSTLSTTVIQPTTSTLTTTVAPTTSTLSTTVIQPTTSTLTTTVIQPTTSTLSTTVIQPVTSTLTTAPLTTTTTTISPTLQTTSPSLLTTSPTLLK